MFAVVSADLIDNDRIVGCLRYIPTTHGLKKLSTSDANNYLKTNYPYYLYASKQMDTVVHAVPLAQVQQHYQPVKRLQQICAHPADYLETLVAHVADYFSSQGLKANALGISGSILISAHRTASDIDLVVYGRNNFLMARSCLRELFSRDNSQHFIQPLSEEQWLQTWQRRGCDLSLDNYIWHEKRKYNKACVDGVKFDLSMVDASTLNSQTYHKQSLVTLNAMIIDDSKAYDYPSRYIIDDPQVNQILSYSATYTGQAIRGELIEARGILEKSANGECRLLVGSSREACGEYLKVM